MISVSSIVVGGGVAVAAVLAVSAEMYVAVWAATYISPILAARWAARTAVWADKAWTDWLDMEQAVREASLAAWVAWGFETQAVEYYAEAWAEAQASANKARAWAARSRAIKG